MKICIAFTTVYPRFGLFHVLSPKNDAFVSISPNNSTSFNLIKFMDWISLEEVLPEQGMDVLLFDGCQIYFGYYSEVLEKFVIGEDKVETTDFTHWMKLPSFPEKQ